TRPEGLVSIHGGPKASAATRYECGSGRGLHRAAALGWSALGALAAGHERADELELDAAVLRARGVQLAALEARRVDNRLVRTEADRGEPALLDALADEV